MGIGVGEKSLMDKVWLQVHYWLTNHVKKKNMDEGCMNGWLDEKWMNGWGMKDGSMMDERGMDWWLIKMDGWIEDRY